MAESSIERQAAKAAEKDGWFQIKMERASKRAVMDRLFIKGGVYVWIEFKQPGEKPTVQQYYRMAQMRIYGAFAYWTDSVEGALDILARVYASRSRQRSAENDPFLPHQTILSRVRRAGKG